MKNTTTGTISTFETWMNGGLQMSAFHTGDDAQGFIYSHYASKSFATLHIFDSIEEGQKAYAWIACGESDECDCSFQEEGHSNHWSNCQSHRYGEILAELKCVCYMPGCN